MERLFGFGSGNSNSAQKDGESKTPGLNPKRGDLNKGLKSNSQRQIYVSQNKKSPRNSPSSKIKLN